jgi:glycosyltransferase involved in cell wall biosynthesis
MLAQALDDALGEPERLRRMGDNSRAIVEREFSWTEVVGRQLGLYEELLSSALAAR